MFRSGSAFRDPDFGLPVWWPVCPRQSRCAVTGDGASVEFGAGCNDSIFIGLIVRYGAPLAALIVIVNAWFTVPAAAERGLINVGLLGHPLGCP
jgi:hypothetical protein